MENSPDYQTTDEQILRRNGAGVEWVPIIPPEELKPDKGTVFVAMGRPRKEVPRLGVHLILYPRFRQWLHSNKATHLVKWDAIKDKRTYFMKLAQFTMLEPACLEPGLLAKLRRYCDEISPELTEAALVILRKKRAKIKWEHYRGGTANPSYAPSNKGEAVNLSQTEIDARARARKFGELFESETRPIP